MMNKVQKYIDNQGRELFYEANQVSYVVTDVPGEGDAFTYAIYGWDGNQRAKLETQYHETVYDVAHAMIAISGDLRKWHVGSRWIRETTRTGI